MKSKAAKPKAFLFSVTLKRTKPIIWRNILVPANVSFNTLHHTIQISMGWTNSHLYEFNILGYCIAKLYEGIEEDERPIINADETTLNDILDTIGETFEYEYDFGDGWMHIIKLENIQLFDPGQQYPYCFAGELKCPPEDCGGIGGFYEMLAILADKTHPEYRDTKRLVGRYNAEEFDLNKVNKKLRNIGRYMKSIDG